MATTNDAAVPRQAFPYNATLFASDQEFAKFVTTLKPSVEPVELEKDTGDNQMQTENGDDAFVSTNNPLVDLFFELTEDFTATRMEQVLAKAWNHDPLATLKIIFNARSIHLGKATRPGAYRALGWLYQNHPQTFIANLVWLVRPVIDQTPVKAESKKNTPTAENPEDFEVVDAPEEPEILITNPAALGASTTVYDVANGAAHGYWKDLPNLLALAVNGEFCLDGDIRKVFNVSANDVKPHRRNWDAEKAKENKKAMKLERFQRATDLFNNDPNYRALHLTIARIFADQLRSDTEILKSGKDLKKISLAAKWVPSPDEFHDKCTWIVGSIAELLHPHDVICPQVDKNDRAQYLMYARMSFRKLTMSPLRKQLEVVERDLTAGTFANINYERVPSLAMEKHQGTFIKKDEAHFSGYLDKVAAGSAKISGAILLPSQMVHKARAVPHSGKKMSGVQLAAQQRVMEGQWNSMVQRIRKSGTISSAIAVCDVSGSMTYPTFRDGTTPMDSAIGLSMLLAEVVDGPFGGHVITFESAPDIFKVGGPNDSRSFREKVKYVESRPWGGSTDFVAVFENLILSVARDNKIKPEDMIKKVFVFSDMQFDAASPSRSGDMSKWCSSFERVKDLYAADGYEMPTLVFWNLAGGRSYGWDGEEDVVGKPVVAEEPGTALVSGYSQGQLKMFLDGGKFEDLEEEVEDVDMDAASGDEDMVDVRVSKKQKVDPLITVKRAISHPAYAMLKVVD
jgi:hypothetical protein